MGDGDYPGDMGIAGAGLGCVAVVVGTILFLVVSAAFHWVFGLLLNGE